MANAFGRLWTFISTLIFIPLYIKFLGIELYGVVGFYSILLSVLSLADVGFTASVTREAARRNIRQASSASLGGLFRTYEVTYLVVSIFVGLFVWLLSPFIVDGFLQSSQDKSEEIILAIRLMGVAIAFQLPSSLYISGLMGLQRQVAANNLLITWSLYRGLGGVLLLWLASPTIIVFAAWQLTSNILHFFTCRRILRLELTGSSPIDDAAFDLRVLRETWRYGASMAVMTIISTYLTQIDKLTVSKMLSLEQLGLYTIATSLAAAPIMLASPIALAVFPRLAEMVSVDDRERLIHLYRRASPLVSSVAIPAGLTIAFFSFDIIRLWTGSSEIASRTSVATSLLVIGQTFQAITLIPFAVAQAYGLLKLNLQIGVFSIVAITPLLAYSTSNFGINGAGFAWALINSLTFPVYMYLLHARFIKEEFSRWLNYGVVLPFFCSLTSVTLGYLLASRSESPFLRFLIAATVFLGAIIASAWISPDLRDEIKKLFTRLSNQAMKR